MYRNLLFDLDGTLTDSEEGITKCVQYGLRAVGIEEPDLKKLRSFIGPPLRDSYAKYFDLNNDEINTAIAAYRERYTDTGIWENRLYPGIPELLRDLRAAGYKLGMCTGKPEPFAVRIAERFLIHQYLDDISGAALDGSKDEKALIVKTSLKRLDLRSPRDMAQTVLIGDRREDVVAAHASGIACIGVGYGFAQDDELEKAGADQYAPTVEALRRIFLNQEDTLCTSTQ